MRLLTMLAAALCAAVVFFSAEAQTRRTTTAKAVKPEPRSFLDPGKPVSSGSGPNYVTMGQGAAAMPYSNQLGARESGQVFNATPFWGF